MQILDENYQRYDGKEPTAKVDTPLSRKRCHLFHQLILKIASKVYFKYHQKKLFLKLLKCTKYNVQRQAASVAFFLKNNIFFLFFL